MMRLKNRFEPLRLVFLGASLGISGILFFIFQSSTLDKRILFLLILFLPITVYQFYPRITLFLAQSSHKDRVGISAAALTGFILVILLNFTLFPLIHHDFRLSLRVSTNSAEEKETELPVILSGVGNHKGIGIDAGTWREFGWQKRRTKMNGWPGQEWASTFLRLPWPNVYLYLVDIGDPEYRLDIALNSRQWVVKLGELEKNDGYYRIPLHLNQIHYFFTLFSAALFTALAASTLYASLRDLQEVENPQEAERCSPIAVLGTSLFFLMIFLPLIPTFLNSHSFDENRFKEYEKREPHIISWKQPEESFTLNSIATAPKEIELWFNDHFALREQFIQFYAYMNYRFLGESFVNDRIVTGRENFLFANDFFQNVMSKHRGVYKIPKKRWSRWIRAHRSRVNFLNEKGIPTLLLLAPDKHSIYPEYLPRWAKKKTGLSFADVALERLRNNIPDLAIVDPRKALLDAKNEWGVYLYGKTDTHWSFAGAYIGYQELRKSMEQITGWEIPLLVPRDVTTLPNPEGFHLAKSLRLEELIDFHDHEVVYTMDEAEDIELDVVKEDNISYTADGYARISWDSFYHISNTKPYVDKKVLVFRDSFASQISPMLNLTFSEVYYIHNYKGLKDIISLVEEYKPDFVLIEVGERGLDSYPFLQDIYPESNGQNN